MQYSCPVCPTSCLNADFPAVDFNDCTDAFISEESEITDIYISSGTVPGDWTNSASWQAVLSQTASNKIRNLTGIGDLTLPEGQNRTVSKGRLINDSSRYRITFDVDDVTDLNYTMLRRMQCGGTFKIWFKTEGNYLYGGPTGIMADIENAGEVLQRGEESYSIFQIIFTWEASCSPDRIMNPIGTEIIPTFIFETQFEPQFE